MDVVADGHAILDALSCSDYDLVLMACQMPVMDGYEATRIIREREAAKKIASDGPNRVSQIPIIALTAHEMEGAYEQCVAAGMNDYLSKPFNQNRLTPVLQRWLPQSPKSKAGPDTDARHNDFSSSPDLKKSPERTTDTETSAVNTPEPADVSSVLQETHSEPVDPKALENIRLMQMNNYPDLLAKMILLYLADSPKYMESVRDALGARDESEIKRAAHTLKSSSATVGALRLADLCKKVEKMGLAGSTETAENVLSEMEAEYEAVKEVLLSLRPDAPTV